MSEVVAYLQHALHSGNLDYEDLGALKRLIDVDSGIGFHHDLKSFSHVNYEIIESLILIITLDIEVLKR